MKLKIPFEEIKDAIEGASFEQHYFIDKSRHGWEHQILVEEIMPDEMGLPNPICFKGKLSCPPEDCGGMGGYYNLLEIKEDKNHLDYEDYIINWLGEDFDPNHFNIEEINKELMEQFIDRRTRYWVKK